jgi:hypothetical protein
MLSDNEFIRQSLELNLFFMRIAKEHSIFLESAFVPKNYNLIQEADSFKNLFTRLLAKTIALSDGIVSKEVASSGELVTKLTLRAETGSEYYSGIFIDKSITQGELSLSQNMRGESYGKAPMLLEQVFMLNQEAITATTALAEFKSRVLNDVLACKIFTFNYPLLLDHILREAKFYIKMLTKLQNRSSMDTVEDIVEQEIFWNRIMAEHAKFIRALLDPTEVDLFNTANNFGTEFDKLTKEAIRLTEKTSMLSKVTGESLNAAGRIRDFKTKGTQGLVDCKIRSIALPLLGDHVIREANHYIRLLNTYSK